MALAFKPQPFWLLSPYPKPQYALSKVRRPSLSVKLRSSVLEVKLRATHWFLSMVK